MSQWSHVNGNIRIDCFGGTEENLDDLRKEIISLLGEIKTYDHVGLFGKWHRECPKSHIPCGSEGSIAYEILKVERGYNIAIWGDLRNYGKQEVEEEIYEWWGNIMKHKFSSRMALLRDAVLHIDIEYGEDIILLFNSDLEEGYKKYVLGP